MSQNQRTLNNTVEFGVIEDCDEYAQPENYVSGDWRIIEKIGARLSQSNLLPTLNTSKRTPRVTSDEFISKRKIKRQEKNHILDMTETSRKKCNLLHQHNHTSKLVKMQLEMILDKSKFRIHQINKKQLQQHNHQRRPAAVSQNQMMPRIPKKSSFAFSPFQRYPSIYETSTSGVYLSQPNQINNLTNKQADLKTSPVDWDDEIITVNSKFFFNIFVCRKNMWKIKMRAHKIFLWAFRMVAVWNHYFKELQKKKLNHNELLAKCLRINEEMTRYFEYSSELTFDKLYYRANRQIELSTEMKNILNIHHLERNDSHIKTLITGFSAISSFDEYPEHLKIRICRVAYYNKIPKQKIIIRQGHEAENFYFILSGIALVTITTDGSEFKTINQLSTGNSFGEIALLHNRTRTASVLSETEMQLLAINRNNFLEIFLPNSENYEKYNVATETNWSPNPIKNLSQQNEDHISFIRNLPKISNFPIEKLIQNPHASILYYYKKRNVICKFKVDDPWIYIIKSGSCDIIMLIPEELITKQKANLNKYGSFIDKFDKINSLYHEYSYSLESKKSGFSPIELNSGTGLDKVTSKIISNNRKFNTLPPCYVDNTNSKNLSSNNNLDFYPVSLNPTPKKHTMISLTKLYPGDIFTDENVYRIPSLLTGSATKSFSNSSRNDENNPVYLISNAAEVILISKRFILNHLNNHTKKEMRRCTINIPTVSEVLIGLDEASLWTNYRKNIYKTLILDTNLKMKF